MQRTVGWMCVYACVYLCTTTFPSQSLSFSIKHNQSIYTLHVIINISSIFRIAAVLFFILLYCFSLRIRTYATGTVLFGLFFPMHVICIYLCFLLFFCILLLLLFLLLLFLYDLWQTKRETCTNNSNILPHHKVYTTDCQPVYNFIHACMCVF